MKELLACARVVSERTHHCASDGLAAWLLNTSHDHAHVTGGEEGGCTRGMTGGGGRMH